MSENDLVQSSLPRWIVEEICRLAFTECKLEFCFSASRCHHEQSNSIEPVSGTAIGASQTKLHLLAVLEIQVQYPTQVQILLLDKQLFLH